MPLWRNFSFSALSLGVLNDFGRFPLTAEPKGLKAKCNPTISLHNKITCVYRKYAIVYTRTEYVIAQNNVRVQGMYTLKC